MLRFVRRETETEAVAIEHGKWVRMAPAARTSHIVVVPYPGRGHINPIMNLCKLLCSSNPSLLITFVVTEEWLGFIGAEEKPAGVRFVTIPNVLPSELERAANMPKFVSATQTEMSDPFELLLDRLDLPVDFIIADTFLMWAVEICRRRNIPVASFWPMPASVFCIFYHFHLLVQRGHHPSDLAERGEERIDYIPGINSIRLNDIPSIAYMKDQRLLQLALQIFPNVSKANCLLLSSVFHLEHQAIAALKHLFQFPVYTVGPAIPYFDLPSIFSSTATPNENHHYFNWLNAQSPSSVLYISMGSFLSVSTTQMDEIADGLRQSGVRFLWVARGETERIKQKCGDQGMVVPWCEQLKVLCHPSVGGFWTHCGWNSTMECIFAGIPIIAFPIIMDQTTIRKHIVEDWKNGWDAKNGLRVGDLLTSKDVANLIKKFMNLEDNERKELTKKALELREATRLAVSDSGSSRANITSLLKDIIVLRQVPVSLN